MKVLPPTDFSYRKFQRKVQADGLKSGIVAAIELFVRKHLGRPLLDPLFHRNILQTLSRPELPNTAMQIYGVDSGTLSETRLPDPPFVADIGQGYLLPRTGIALTDQLEIIEESVAQPRNARQFVMASLVHHSFTDDYPIGRRLLRSDRQAIDAESEQIDLAAPLMPRFPNYYHWMVETVPRVRYLEAYEDRTGEDVTVVVRADAPSWVEETLGLLAWPESKIERATAPIYNVRRLLVPSFPDLYPRDYDWIRERVLTSASPGGRPNNSGRNVYISRAGAIERRVVNEAEVMSILSPYDFDLYRLEESTVGQNAQLFEQADLIVGPHGAGLTDLIFCEEGAVLELFGSKIKPPYEQLAKVLDVPYDSIKCRPESTDIRVDTEELEQAVSRMLS